MVSLVGSGSGSVAAASDKIDGCVIDGDMVVAGVAIAAGLNVTAFFVELFLLDGAGIVVVAEYNKEHIRTCGKT